MQMMRKEGRFLSPDFLISTIAVSKIQKPVCNLSELLLQKHNSKKSYLSFGNIRNSNCHGWVSYCLRVLLCRFVHCVFTKAPRVHTSAPSEFYASFLQFVAILVMLESTSSFLLCYLYWLVYTTSCSHAVQSGTNTCKNSVKLCCLHVAWRQKNGRGNKLLARVAQSTQRLIPFRLLLYSHRDLLMHPVLPGAHIFKGEVFLLSRVFLPFKTL